jgi:hypothetical protein
MVLIDGDSKAFKREDDFVFRDQDLELISGSFLIFCEKVILTLTRLVDVAFANQFAVA